MLNEPCLIKTFKELKDALQVDAGNQFTIGSRNFKMDQKFIASIEHTERDNIRKSARQEQKQEELADDGDFYAQMIADMADKVDSSTAFVKLPPRSEYLEEIASLGLGKR